MLHVVRARTGDRLHRRHFRIIVYIHFTLYFDIYIKEGGGVETTIVRGLGLFEAQVVSTAPGGGSTPPSALREAVNSRAGRTLVPCSTWGVNNIII